MVVAYECCAIFTRVIELRNFVPRVLNLPRPLLKLNVIRRIYILTEFGDHHVIFGECHIGFLGWPSNHEQIMCSIVFCMFAERIIEHFLRLIIEIEVRQELILFWVVIPTTLRFRAFVFHTEQANRFHKFILFVLRSTEVWEKIARFLCLIFICFLVLHHLVSSYVQNHHTKASFIDKILLP